MSEVLYQVDPKMRLPAYLCDGTPRQVGYNDCIWNGEHVRFFLHQMGQEGWIMVEAHPLPVFYKVEENETER